MPLIDMYDKISTACDRNEYAIGIFIDLSKAFDTLDHSILLRKLYHYGIRGITHDWFASYLTNRKQYVSINNTDSSFESINCGVPQGSILGPLLFLIYINDIINCSKLLQFILFADDTNIFYSCNDLRTLETTVNNELLKLSIWFCANRLSLNIKKTNYIVFGNKKLPHDINLHINSISIVRVEFTKFLGVYIDAKVTWKNHIEIIASKIAKGLGILNKVKLVLPQNVLLMLYNSLIYPYLNYCAIVWGCAGATLLHKLEILQKRAVRMIANVYYLESTKPIFYELKLLKVKEIFTLQRATFMFKIKCKLLPGICSRYVSVSNSAHRHHSMRKSFYFIHPSCRTKIRENSLSYHGPRLWETLPVSIQNSLSIGYFIRSTMAFLIASYNVLD